MAEKIKKFGEVIETLTELALKLGTLLAVIKMIAESMR